MSFWSIAAIALMPVVLLTKGPVKYFFFVLQTICFINSLILILMR